MSESDSSPPISSIPPGYCLCGCGKMTTVAPRTYSKRGIFKGQPYRFIRGHQRRSNPDDHYKIEDRGYKTPCWIWQLGKNKSGYGSIRRDGSMSTPAHRWYYEQRFGLLPSKVDLHHLCENKDCVNPEHLDHLAHGKHSSFHARRDRSKLTMKQAQTVRILYAAGGTSQGRLAEQFGVTKRTIRLILRNELWKP